MAPTRGDLLPQPHRLLGILTTLTALGLLSGPAAAQVRELVVEAGASQMLPPAGVAGDEARFLVGGVRGTWLSNTGSGVFGYLLGGRAANGTAAGDFLSAETMASGWLGIGSDWSVGLRGRALGFLVGAPFPYRAGALEAGPSLRLLRPNLSVRVDGTAGVGHSRIEFESVALPDGTWEHRGHMGNRPDPPQDSVVLTEVVTDLWRYGGSAEVLTQVGSVVLGAAGGMHRTTGGTFRSTGVRILRGGERLVVGLRLDMWWTPYGREGVGGLTLSIPVGRDWSLRGFFGKSEPDPLTLAASSGGGGGILLGRRIGGRGDRRTTVPLYEVLGRKPSGASVRFAVPAPSSTALVELVGDFTSWEPLAMEWDGGKWILELDVPEGLYYFGFLVDGDWYVPVDATGTVPDEWGRRNAILLVEEQDVGEGGAPGNEDGSEE